MIDTIVLYILILIFLTLTLIQGNRSARKQKLLPQIFHKVFNWFEWNFVYWWGLLVWWTSYSFHFFHSVLNFKGENHTFKKNKQTNTLKLWFVFRHLLTDFFQTWYADRDYSAVHFDISFDDLDLQSRSQFEKSKTLVSIFLKYLKCRFGWNSVCSHNLICLLKLMLNLILRKLYLKERTLLTFYGICI